MQSSMYYFSFAVEYAVLAYCIEGGISTTQASYKYKIIDYTAQNKI